MTLRANYATKQQIETSSVNIFNRIYTISNVRKHVETGNNYSILYNYI